MADIDVGKRTLGNAWDWTSSIGRSPTEYLDDQNSIHTDMARENLSIKQMNDERAARRANQMLGTMQPQGVVRQPSQPYGSENMHNYIPSARPNTAQHQRMLNDQLEGMGIPKAEQQAVNAGRDYRHAITGNVNNQGAAGINSTAAGAAAILGTSEAKRDEIDMRENSEARLRFNARPENKGMVPISLGSSIGYRDPNYVGASPTSFGSPFGEYETSRPQQQRQSAEWHASMKGKPLPTRDMRDNVYTSRVTGREVPNYPAMNKMSMRRAELAQNKSANVNSVGKFGSNQSLGANQSSDTQLANNGNINNPKITNKPNANGSNGFF